MEPCTSAKEFLGQSLDRYFVGRDFIAWHSETGVGGFTAWGRPDAQSAAALCAVLDAGLDREHFSLVDVRGLSGIDYAAFDVVFRGIRDRQDDFARTVRKQAVLRPEGVAGAIVLGFYGLMTVRYPVRHFTTLEDAIDWFGIEDPPRILRELGAMMTAVQGIPDLVARIRATLASSLGRGSPEELARGLGMSRRTLQRKLEAMGTSLRDEVHAFRVERTKVLLHETEASLVVIAEAVGFESVRTLNDVFRKHTGTTPRLFREQAP